MNGYLHRFVAVSDHYPAGTCWAWMDTAERVCGKPEGDQATHLCNRHAAVALRKAHAEVARERARAAQEVLAERAADQSSVESRISVAHADAASEHIDPLTGEVFDHDPDEVYEAEVVPDEAALWQQVLDLERSRGKKPSQITADFAQWSGGVLVEDADALAFSQYLDHLKSSPAAQAAAG